jgi:hypothetical protein
MKRVFWVGGSMAILAWGLQCALVGCGDDPPPASPADSGSEAGNPVGSSSGGTSGAPTVDSSGGTSGTATSNPGKITCGAAECDAGDRGGGNCCERDGGRACANNSGTMNTCNERGAFRIRCDEKADCDAEEKCCGSLDDDDGAIRVTGTTCARDCEGRSGAGEVQICKTTEECGDAGACAEKTCGGRVLRVCGTPTACQ